MSPRSGRGACFAVAAIAILAVIALPSCAVVNYDTRAHPVGRFDRVDGTPVRSTRFVVERDIRLPVVPPPGLLLPAGEYRPELEDDRGFYYFVPEAEGHEPLRPYIFVPKRRPGPDWLPMVGARPLPSSYLGGCRYAIRGEYRERWLRSVRFVRDGDG